MKKNSIDSEHSCLDPGVKHRDDGVREWPSTGLIGMGKCQAQG